MIEHKIKMIVKSPGEQFMTIDEFKKIFILRNLEVKWFGGVEKSTIIAPEKNVQ